MKSHIGLISVLTVLAAVLFLSVLISCNDRGTQLRQALAAADSLMMTDPLAALDTLLTIDSADAARLPRADRALYTLLRTEAGYKCWLPVAGNTTAISEAVDYYRRKGPEDRLARALVMQGVVLSEQSDTEGAMLTYKEAEPLLERSGDLEQLGLLHTRIGDLYGYYIADDSSAVYRYSKALECFEKAGLNERVIFTHLSLASILIDYSEEPALHHADTALLLAKMSDNRLGGINAHMLRMHSHFCSGDYKKAVSEAGLIFAEYGGEPQNDRESISYASIYGYLSESYAALGLLDSAAISLKRINATTAVDTLTVLSALAELAEKSGDSITAYRYRLQRDSIYIGILDSEYNANLLEVERKYDNDSLRNELSRKRWTTIAVVSLLLLLVTTLTIIIMQIKHKLERQNVRILSLVSTAQELKGELQSAIATRDRNENDLKNLFLEIQKQTDANKELMSLNGDLLAVTKDISDLYYIYGDTASKGWLESKIRDTLTERLRSMKTSVRIDRMLESVYPGFMSMLCSKYPWLSQDERELISLMCCGFTTNAVSIIMNLDIKKLNDKKTRLARKMGISIRLSTYLRQALSKYKKVVDKSIHTSDTQ